MIFCYWKVFFILLISNGAFSNSIDFSLRKIPYEHIPQQSQEKTSPLVYNCDNEDISDLKSMLKLLQITNENIVLKLKLMEQDMKLLQSTVEAREQQMLKTLDVDPGRQYSTEFKEEIIKDLTAAIDEKNQAAFKSFESSLTNKLEALQSNTLEAMFKRFNESIRNLNNNSNVKTNFKEMIEKAHKKQENTFKDVFKSQLTSHQALKVLNPPTICGIRNALPKNCAEALKGNLQCPDGPYLLSTCISNLGPFQAYCNRDSTDSEAPAWTVIQRRVNGDTDFYRNWEEYKNGFGDLKTNFWLGLEYIHALTSEADCELLIELEDWNGVKRHAKYNKFRVASERETYKLIELGKYNGTAGDSFSYRINARFSTKDADNDTDPFYHCAKQNKGGWWYSHCHYSTLNGVYNSTELDVGVNWHAWHGYRYSLKYVQMSIRPRKEESLTV